MDRRIVRWLLLGATVVCALPGCAPSQMEEVHWSDRPLVRSDGNPLIRPGMSGLEGAAGANINGPTVIRVPDWVPNRLGDYYMYFAHHRGKYIRLAVADDPAGPWRVHPPGVLQLDQTAAVNHIASPDVVLDADSRTIRMYFHGPVREGGQRSFVATSPDGLTFTPSLKPLGLPYFRVFQFDGTYYAVGKRGAEAGVLLRSKDGLSPFEEGPDLIPRMRHAAVHRDGNRLTIFYSRIGDTPERLLKSVVDLKGAWSGWAASAPSEVLRPEEPYEGVDLPIATSIEGEAEGPLHELRDPGLLIDGRVQYLYYSVAAEQGIAMARFR